LTAGVAVLRASVVGNGQGVRQGSTGA
jgi:hypothetical protein